MLPPLSTTTAGVSKRVGSSSMAATPAAPAGSTTCLARSAIDSTARDSESSETVTMSSTNSCTASKVTWPGQPTAMPSAMVRMCSRATGCPSASDLGYAAAPAAWTPTTRTSGRAP